MKCPYCGSEKIELSISWGKTAEVGSIGLEYRTGKGLFNETRVAEVYSDLCLDCKSIVRSYIKEDTNKYWCHRN